MSYLSVDTTSVLMTRNENLKLVSQQYRAWSDCMDVQAGLALYWWQKLITFSFCRRRVKLEMKVKILNYIHWFLDRLCPYYLVC